MQIEPVFFGSGKTKTGFFKNRFFQDPVRFLKNPVITSGSWVSIGPVFLPGKNPVKNPEKDPIFEFKKYSRYVYVI